jgi:two-component system, OmpR family, phosphate regulon sensor histidine kinase PhoR
MSKHPLGAGFAMGMLIASGAVSLVGLVGLLLIGSSRAAILAVLVGAGVAGVAGGMAGVGWTQAWRDAIRNLSSYRSNPAVLTRNRWPISVAQIHDRIVTLTEQRDDAFAGQGFVQQRLEAIVAGLRDGVIVIGPDLGVISINDAACKMMGVTHRQAIGLPLVEVARDFDLVQVAQESIERGHAQITPVDYRRADRQLNMRVLPIDQGARRLAVLVVQDVTELRRLERVRQDFVANVSHELRTPLAAIRALVETLNEGALEDETVAHDFLERVVDEVDRLNELIEELLDLGRLESGRMVLRKAEIDVPSLIQRALERVRHQADEAGIRIVLDIPADLPQIYADIARTAQVLVNLMGNAIKYSQAHSEVLIEARESEEGVRISVRDVGVGILPEDLGRIFERFYKADRARHSGGSGLGLAIAKHIVQEHGGRLLAESEFGKGSTFTVILPVGERSAAT